MIDPHEFRNEEYDDGYGDAEDFERAGADQIGDEEDVEYDEELQERRRRRLHPTNIEFVSDLMNFSNFGALSQIFIMDAIGKHAEAVAGIPLEEVQRRMGDGFIDARAWHGVATEISARLKEHYKS